MFFCRYSSILDDDNENLLRSVIDTNIFGLLLCTKEAFKLMKTRDGYGFIININSIVGHKVPFIAGVKPYSNIYSGTKHAVTAATEVLRQELIFMKNDRIRVSVSTQHDQHIPVKKFDIHYLQSVSPGVVATEFRDAAGFPNNPTFAYSNMAALNADDVSDAVMYLLRTKPHVNVRKRVVLIDRFLIVLFLNFRLLS
jgi:NADP+-dependent farnesol dehydrogenase